MCHYPIPEIRSKTTSLFIWCALWHWTQFVLYVQSSEKVNVTKFNLNLLYSIHMPKMQIRQQSYAVNKMNDASTKWEQCTYYDIIELSFVKKTKNKKQKRNRNRNRHNQAIDWTGSSLSAPNCQVLILDILVFKNYADYSL